MWEVELVCEAPHLFLNAPICRVVESLLGIHARADTDGHVLRVHFASSSHTWLATVRAAQGDLARLGLGVRAYLVNPAPSSVARRQQASA